MHKKTKVSGILIFCVMVVLCSTAFTFYQTMGAKGVAYDVLLAKKRSAVSCSPAVLTSSDDTSTFPKNFNCSKESMNDNKSPNTNDRNGCSHMSGMSTLQCGSTAHKRRYLRDFKDLQI
jgi:hypothetical protein